MSQLIEEILEKPFGEITISDLLSIARAIRETPTETITHTNIIEPEISEYDYGIDGLARILNCGKTKAQEYKNSGLLDLAITRAGRSIMIHKETALKLFRKHF